MSAESLLHARELGHSQRGQLVLLLKSPFLELIKRRSGTATFLFLPFRSETCMDNSQRTIDYIRTQIIFYSSIQISFVFLYMNVITELQLQLGLFEPIAGPRFETLSLAK